MRVAHIRIVPPVVLVQLFLLILKNTNYAQAVRVSLRLLMAFLLLRCYWQLSRDMRWELLMRDLLLFGYVDQLIEVALCDLLVLLPF